MISSDIISFIPQRRPFVMVSTLSHVDETITRTEFIIDPENIFVDDSKFTEAGLLENIAQTAAAGEGYRALVNKKAVIVGYIAAVKNFEVFQLPEVNDVLTTEVAIMHHIFNVTNIKGTVSCNGLTIAECQMKIFINDTQ